jgi:hypothetical protein
MGSALNTAFYLPFGTRDSDRIRSESALIQDLLCYDTVLVLTDHMAAAGMLAALMGTKALETALDSGVIRFVNDRNVLCWTGRTRSGGVSPILHMRGQPTLDQPSAFTEHPIGVLTQIAAAGFGLSEVDAANLADKAERATIDFTEPLVLGQPAGNSGGRGLVAEAIEKIKTYKEVIPRLQGLSLTLGDLLRLERDLRDPGRSPLHTTTLRVLKSTLFTGWDVAEQSIQMSRKQLGLLNLYLSDHFLAIHAAAAPESTLHTERLVEEILSARLSGIRAAAGNEINAVLQMAQVQLPQLAPGSSFPYEELLKIRNSHAAKAFRQVVEIRDMEDKELIQAYYAELENRFGSRTSTRTARLISTSLAGTIPGLGSLLSVADTFLLERFLGKRDARYFIDEQLTRLTEQKKLPGKQKR